MDREIQFGNELRQKLLCPHPIRLKYMGSC